MNTVVFKKLTNKKITLNTIFLGLFVLFFFNACGVKQLSSKMTTKSTTEVVTSPQKTPTPNPLLINKISAGDNFTCASGKISDNTQPHSIYCWGNNQSNQLVSTAASNPQLSPLLIPQLATRLPVFSLSAAFGCMLRGDDDSVSCWGKNDQFQLGNAQQTTGNTGLPPTNISDPNNDSVLLISAGAFHTCFYTASGLLQCLGQNNNGSMGRAIGINSISTTLVTISSSLSSTLSVQRLVSSRFNNYLLMSDGTVGCWGSNNLGQCGLNNVNTPVGLSSVPLPAGILAKDIASLNSSFCILSQTNQVYCAGANANGILGDGTTTQRNSLTLASTLTGTNVRKLPSSAQTSNTNCIVTQAGGVKCWGINTAGSVGVNNVTTPQMSPLDVLDGTMAPITQVSDIILPGNTNVTSSGNTPCALKTDGSVWCWGNNALGQVGSNSVVGNIPVAARTQLPLPAKSIFAGSTGACAILTDESLHCWGGNYNGRLGNNSTANNLVPRSVIGLQNRVESVVMGDNHTCVLMVDKVIKCFGGNMNGILGESNLSLNRYTASAPLPFFGDLTNVSSVVTGSAHSCVIVLGGYPKCFGNNQSGQLGIGNNTSTPIPSYVQGTNSMITQIALGENHSCFLGRDGLVYCTGANSFGQLANGSTMSQSTPQPIPTLSGITQITSGKNHLCGINTNGNVLCWGNNVSGQLGINSNLNQLTPRQVSGLTEQIIGLAAGRSHTCALGKSKKVYCWGGNSFGQLGLSLYFDTFVPAEVTELRSANIKELTAGENHTCAVSEDNNMYCWGANESGQLGNSTLNNSAKPLLVLKP